MIRLITDKQLKQLRFAREWPLLVQIKQIQQEILEGTLMMFSYKKMHSCEPRNKGILIMI